MAREQGGQFVDPVAYEISGNNLNTRRANFRDIALLGGVAGLNGALAQQCTDLGAIDVLRPTREIAQDRHPKLAGT